MTQSLATASRQIMETRNTYFMAVNLLEKCDGAQFRIAERTPPHGQAESTPPPRNAVFRFLQLPPNPCAATDRHAKMVFSDAEPRLWR